MSSGTLVVDDSSGEPTHWSSGVKTAPLGTSGWYAQERFQQQYGQHVLGNMPVARQEDTSQVSVLDYRDESLEEEEVHEEEETEREQSRTKVGALLMLCCLAHCRNGTGQSRTKEGHWRGSEHLHGHCPWKQVGAL
ncbi:hypothetical protein NDU88_002321 [Pleurodeles waltl]|uniref:Uncharacterized protein n=1 Tax=Pleurodeles waltl TaxID=8319 RepID=A0AAV7WQB4_PLEWA|nr:hypothetical protein NDU88_002321 [Pleurodeles waltl]